MMRRRSFSTFALRGALVAVLASLAACSSASGSLGSACLRSDDCAVGICSALQCRLPPTDPNARASGGANALEATPVDAGMTPDAGAASESDADTPADATPEQG